MEQNTQKQPKLWLAILTAIGLGLVGCLLWGLLYYFGYLAWLGGYVVVVAAAWGYQKFNLKLDKKGYFIISAIAVVEIALTMLITLNIVVMQTAGTGFFDSFALLSDLLAANSELSSALITDAILSLVFIALGLITYFITEKKKAKQNKTVEQKLDVNVNVNQTVEVKNEQPEESKEASASVAKTETAKVEEPKDTKTEK